MLISMIITCTQLAAAQVAAAAEAVAASRRAPGAEAAVPIAYWVAAEYPA